MIQCVKIYGKNQKNMMENYETLKKFPKQSEKHKGKKYAEYDLFFMKKRQLKKNKIVEYISGPCICIHGKIIFEL